ncbi:helix-turn-helix transcriptional regulator [Catenulispora pinisilvae]|uniref:helix-turn-helix transcriptional regulator n=1 Tax=Catenulispora pinisilvae TaxID=2705253 RepID=UPI0018926D42|nr:AraC family transcriptional regulator [Catenulispora pinisilvae]
MTAPPENLADRPALPATSDDLLSELLRSVRLNGERAVRYAPPPDFSVDFAGTGSLHIVEEGRLALRIDESPHVEHLDRGDFVLLPRGDRHRIGDAGEPASWLCGTFTIGDPQASHLLGSLPAVIILRGGEDPALEGLEVARKMLGLEMRAPTQGSAVMVARILDLIFIQIMRTWAAGPDAEPNWLAGAFDPQIGLALSAMHREPAREWTVEDLARVCSLSRSAFAARFADRVGKPPATYLAHVRLDAAMGLLRDTSLPVTHIAERVGYTSEPAFSRAFKSRYGTPPARWRKDARGR